MAQETILVVGGAGYVGAHSAMRLAQAGFRVVVFDNLVNGHQSFVRFGPFERGDVRDRARLEEVIVKHRPAAVLHFAALIEVGESFRDPAEFYDVNVVGALKLLESMRAHGLDKIVFSSTCATYGPPQRLPLDESHPQAPINPYGQTKLIVETALKDYAAGYGFKPMILRYFNAAGAAPEHGLGERHDPETHVVPLAIFSALGRRGSFQLLGEDYDTRDGTCVRDYVHVLDLADAHVAAVQALLGGSPGDALNLGTGAGTSVKELISAVERVTGIAVPILRAARRPGDAAELVADSSKALRLIGWRARRSIDDVIASAWRWHTETEPRLFPA
jgi:UDP-glucose 4-epimerase